MRSGDKPCTDAMCHFLDSLPPEINVVKLRVTREQALDLYREIPPSLADQHATPEMISNLFRSGGLTFRGIPMALDTFQGIPIPKPQPCESTLFSIKGGQ